MPITLRGVTFGSGVSPVGSVTLGGTVAANFFVDSVAGNDSNNGTSAATPKKTLNAVPWANNVVGALKCGSFFSESLDIQAFSGITIRSYGSGPLPIIDGTAIVSSWTIVSGNVWHASVNQDTTGSNRLTVYENDVLLTQVVDVATCQATPGSFVECEASLGNPANIQIQPSDSGNPNTNGKVYRVTVRALGLVADANCTLQGIRTQRVIGNNGSCETHLNSDWRQVLAVYGTKHNMLIGGGIMADIIACRADLQTVSEPSNVPIVQFTTDAAGVSLNATRMFIVADGAPGAGSSSPFINHDLAGHSFTACNMTQIATSNVVFPIQPGALTVTVNAWYAQNAGQPAAWFANTANVRYLLAQQPNGANGATFQSNGSANPVWNINDSVFYDQGSFDGLFRMGSNYNGATLNLTNCVIYSSAARNFFTEEGATSGTIVCNFCIFVSAGGAQIDIANGQTYQGNHNVFITNNGGNSFAANYHGTGYSTLAAWQGATSQDANSITVPYANLSQVYPGTVANGDFRLGNSGSGATVAALGAGPQTRWDWNAQQAAPGQPSAWPNIPTTLAQCEAYVENPTGWIF